MTVFRAKLLELTYIQCIPDLFGQIIIKKQGMTGFELSELLYKNGIEDEITNEKSTMLLCGIGTDLKKIQRLEKVLKRISK